MNPLAEEDWDTVLDAVLGRLFSTPTRPNAGHV
jgi:hypothetical protein